MKSDPSPAPAAEPAIEPPPSTVNESSLSENSSAPPPGDLPNGEAAAPQPPHRGHVRRVVEGTFNYGLGQSIPQFVKLLLLPVFTRILTPTDYGAVEVANRFGGFITTLMRQAVSGAGGPGLYQHPRGPAPPRQVPTGALDFLGP